MVAALALGGCIDDFDDPKGYGAGSTSECRDICVEASDCPGSDEPSASECVEQCDELEQVARRADCRELFDGFVTCYTRLRDICAAEDECGEEGRSFIDCFSEHCEEYPDDCSSF
ncbi:MAG TPA: hypothetical protein VFZ53_04695 [Polyangiaceae bacterium]